MLPSPQRTGSASATSVSSWLNPIPHTIAVYASAPPLPDGPATLATGRLATPYPSGTSTRWTAPASPGAPAATGPPISRRTTSPPGRWRDPGTGIRVRGKGNCIVAGQLAIVKLPICECGRSLRPMETQCPHCERVSSARWRTSIKYVASATGTLAVTAVLAIVTKGVVKPRA